MANIGELLNNQMVGSQKKGDPVWVSLSHGLMTWMDFVGCQFHEFWETFISMSWVFFGC